MVSYLNSVRKTLPNGFHLFTSSQYVLLGHELSAQWATRIADEIKGAMVRSRPSSSLSSPGLTTEAVLRTIQSERNMLNVRPAIIHQLLWNFQGLVSIAPVDFLDAKLSASCAAIVMKMRMESASDFMRALESLQRNHDFLKILLLLAEGETLVSALCTETYLSFEKFAALLCGLNYFLPGSRPKLLPPYAHLCKELIQCKNGMFTLNLSKFLTLRLEVLSPRFQSLVNTISEFGLKFSAEDQEMISQAVVECLFQNFIRAADFDRRLIPVRSVFDHALLEETHRAALLGHSKEEKGGEAKFATQLKEYNHWMSAGERLDPKHGSEYEEWKAAVPKPGNFNVGMMIVKDLRICQSHAEDYVPRLLQLGWPLVVLERLALVLSECVIRSALPHVMTPSGFPVLRTHNSQTGESDDRSSSSKSL